VKRVAAALTVGCDSRHVNDWSAILLLDARYTQTSTQAMLPSWISQNMTSPTSFGHLVRDLAGFMKSRR
jgi:chromosome transmission fidelity protein 1